MRGMSGLTIIFSTIARVSPSRSLSLEFSGVIFVVSILGAFLTTFSHHVDWFAFSRDSTISLWSSAAQVLALPIASCEPPLTQRPGRVVYPDFLAKVIVNDRLFAFATNFQVRLLDIDN